MKININANAANIACKESFYKTRE